MVEIFYATSVPQQDGKTEFYSLVYAFAPGEALVVRQGHGWADFESNDSRCEETVLATVDSEAEAKRIYEEARAKILSLGFAHAPSGLWTIPAPASARGAA